VVARRRIVRTASVSKHDKEPDDENCEHLSTRIQARSLTKLPLPDAAASAEKIEPRKHGASAEEDVLDITDSRTYSIEEAKHKQEEDDRVAAAERKKQRMRLEIAELRKEFMFLLKKNTSLERAHQLPRDAFELDPKLRLELEAEVQAKIDEVRAELAWISEKHSLAPLVCSHFTRSKQQILPAVEFEFDPPPSHRRAGRAVMRADSRSFVCR
jgi:hypothetical protein